METAEVTWLVVNVVGWCFALAFLLDGLTSYRLASRNGWSLATRLYLGQVIAAVFLVIKFTVTTWLGYVVVTDIGVGGQTIIWGLVAANALVVVFLIIMWISHYLVIGVSE